MARYRSRAALIPLTRFLINQTLAAIIRTLACGVAFGTDDLPFPTLGANPPQWRTPGKRLSTRMAYLVDTIAPDGIAVALTGFIMRNDLTGWTKHPRRIEWADLIKQWSRQPTVADVRKV